MKKSLLLLVFGLSAVLSCASAKSPSVCPIIDTTIKEITGINLVLDLGEISEDSFESFSNAIDKLFQLNELEKELECSITVRGKFGIGDSGIEVEVTVSGPCDEVRKQAKEILKELSEIGNDAR